VIRINLLPPEIIERRKYERFYPYVFVATAILLAVVLVSWGGIQLMLSARNQELQRIRESAVALEQDAAKLAVFELQEQELGRRQEAVGLALLHRRDMGRLAEEISLVLPEEVWVQTITLSEDPQVGMTAGLFAPNPLGNKVTDGYKSVASTLVRLGSLQLLENVWLTNAESGEYAAFQGVVTENSAVGVVSFNVSALVATPTADVAGE
jgi:Tfp pilus assembly protein PilN